MHERASAVFTVHLAQYAPAVVAGEEDRVVVGAGGLTQGMQGCRGPPCGREREQGASVFASVQCSNTYH